VSELVSTAWASAATFRGSTSRAAQTAHAIRLGAAEGLDVNQPAQLAKVRRTLEAIQKAFNASLSGGKKVSLADLIVLGGGAAIEQAAKAGGHDAKALHAGTHGRVAGADRRPLVRTARADRRRVPQLCPRQAAPVGRGAAGGSGATADAERRPR